MLAENVKNHNLFKKGIFTNQKNTPLVSRLVGC